MRILLLLAGPLLLSGCSLFCNGDKERPEFLLDSARPKTVEKEVEWVSRKIVYYLKEEEFREAYDLMSWKTRDQWGYWKARIGIFVWTLPGTDLKLPDLIRRSETLAFDIYREKGKEPSEMLWIVEIKLPDKSSRLFNLLMVKDERDKGRWRLGLRDQEMAGPSFPAE
jgi:hypothetical protein